MKIFNIDNLFWFTSTLDKLESCCKLTLLKGKMHCQECGADFERVSTEYVKRIQKMATAINHDDFQRAWNAGPEALLAFVERERERARRGWIAPLSMKALLKQARAEEREWCAQTIEHFPADVIGHSEVFGAIAMAVRKGAPAPLTPAGEIASRQHWRERAEAAEATVTELKRVLGLIAIVDQGAGGNLSFKEMAESAMRQARVVLERLAKNTRSN